MTRTVVACSSSEQFCRISVASSGALHSASKRMREGQRVRKECGLASTCAPHSLYQALLFAFDQMSSWYSAAGYGWSGSCGSWYGRRRGSWGGKSEVRSMLNGSARSAVLETGGVVRIADTVRVSRTTMRIPHRPRHRRKLVSWRRR